MKYFSVFFLGAFLLMLAPAGRALAWQGEEGNGLHAEYFNGTNFQQKVYSRIDREINFNHLHESPAPGVNKTN